jgi:hypothetical protein
VVRARGKRKVRERERERDIDRERDRELPSKTAERRPRKEGEEKCDALLT